MSEVKSVLDDVFARPEKEVKYFVGVMAAPVEDMTKLGAKGTDIERITSGQPEKVRAAVFAQQVSANVQIEHGWDGDDYVWHIEPAQRRKWASSVDRAIYATAKVMSGVIPDTVKVNIHKPYLDWEIKVFTFKALGLKRCWNVSKADIDVMNLRLFKVLNTLV